VRLTARGRDYLEASALTLLISVVAGPAVAGVLAMTLIVMAGVSLLLLRYSYATTNASVEPSRLRMFKQRTRSVVLRVGAQRSGFAQVSSVTVLSPPGLTVEAGKLERGAMELSFSPEYAGSFSGFRAVIGVADPMALFAQTREVQLDLVVDVLPLSLLLEDRPLIVAPMTYGEVPSGTRGAGQEHYDVEPYAPGLDAHDLMWKRIARFGEDELQVRVREASTKGDVGIVVAMRGDKSERKVVRTDLASEAIAQIGKRLISFGVRVELVYSRQGRARGRMVSNVVELADWIVESWSGDASGDGLHAALARADLAILGPQEYEDGVEATPAGSRLTLVIWDRSGRPDPGGRFFVFTGADDLAPLAEAILEG
jgi:hypothetical protein